MLVKLENKTAEYVAAAVAGFLSWDQGKEMAAHASSRIATGVQATSPTAIHPGSVGAMGTGTGSKGTDLSAYSQHEFDAIAALLNERPRQASRRILMRNGSTDLS